MHIMMRNVMNLRLTSCLDIVNSPLMRRLLHFTVMRHLCWKILASLCHSGDDVVVFNVVRVVSLDVGGEPVKRALDGLFGRRVHHPGVLEDC